MTEQSANQTFHASSFLQEHNAEFIEQPHSCHADDPASVDASWQARFDSFGQSTCVGFGHRDRIDHHGRRDQRHRRGRAGAVPEGRGEARPVVADSPAGLGRAVLKVMGG